jgi:hypothetical protein
MPTGRIAVGQSSPRALSSVVMRTAPLVGTKAWFGPRRLGWGLEPISIEGWGSTVAFVALARMAKKRAPESRWARHVLGLSFLALTLLKGTSPGGKRARAALRTTGEA